jgi:hypothetical protein
MTKEDVGNGGYSATAISLDRRRKSWRPVVQENTVRLVKKNSLFNLLRGGSELSDDLLMEYGDEKGYDSEDDGQHVVPWEECQPRRTEGPNERIF